jgi:signal transduction histidine kinase
LVSNAIKYHDKNKEDLFLKVTINITKKSATLIFEDNGIGIEEEYLEKIFKMFFRATEESEGSGIGLYIVHQALEKIHGKVSVKSKPNIGSTFTVKIPNLITQKKV